MLRKLSLIFVVFCLAACQNLEFEQNKTIDSTSKKSVLKRIAENIKQSGDVQAAAQIEAQIIELDNKDANSYISLAQTIGKYAEKSDVLAVLNEGEKNNPNSEEIKLAIAKIYLEENDADAALAKIAEIKDAKQRDYYNLKGVALDIQGKYPQAQKEYEQGLKFHQRDNLLLNNLGLSKILSRDYAKAITILEELANRNKGKENSQKYYHNLALAYGLKGETAKAKKILGRDLTQEEIDENLRVYKELR